MFAPSSYEVLIVIIVGELVLSFVERAHRFARVRQWRDGQCPVRHEGQLVYGPLDELALLLADADLLQLRGRLHLRLDPQLAVVDTKLVHELNLHRAGAEPAQIGRAPDKLPAGDFVPVLKFALY